MDWHNAAFSQVTSPILIDIFIVDSIFKIVGQQIFKLERSSKFEVNFRNLPMR